MTMIKTIYLDMDGVLSDFMTRFKEINGDWKRSPEGKKSRGWQNFCESRQFATLDTWPGAAELLEFVASTGINTEILTSTGGPDYHEIVTEDKIKWCEDHGVFHHVNTVPGRWHKKVYARPTAVLIDDTADVIEEWTAAGGIGILHTDVNKTIDELKKCLTSAVI